jgi:hypothetical protein
MHLNAHDCIQGESSSVLGMWFTAVPSRVEGVALMSLPRSQEELWDVRRVNRGAPSEVAGDRGSGAALRCAARPLAVCSGRGFDPSHGSAGPEVD